MKKYLIATALILSVQALPALAQDDGQHKGPPPSFDQLDKDGDGSLSKAEVKGPLAEQFDTLDADGSGTLSESEFPSGPSGKGRPAKK